MQLSQDAMLLRIFFGERDRFEGKRLYDVIVQKARELHLAGATVLRGPMGMGSGLVTLEKVRVIRYGDGPAAA
jgi:uncharacterized protein